MALILSLSMEHDHGCRGERGVTVHVKMRCSPEEAAALQAMFHAQMCVDMNPNHGPAHSGERGLPQGEQGPLLGDGVIDGEFIDEEDDDR